MAQSFNLERPKEDRFLRLKDVCLILGIGKSTLYKLIGEGKFPAATKFGSRTAVWLSSVVYDVMHRIMNEGNI